jgi:hypothetical protein
LTKTHLQPFFLCFKQNSNLLGTFAQIWILNENSVLCSSYPMGPGHVLGLFRKGDKALSDGVSMSKTRKVLMNKSSGHTALKHLFKNCLTMYPKPQRSESILSMRRVTRPRGTVWYLHWWQTRGPTTMGSTGPSLCPGHCHFLPSPQIQKLSPDPLRWVSHHCWA